jgi:hypothetical protein
MKVKLQPLLNAAREQNEKIRRYWKEEESLE